MDDKKISFATYDSDGAVSKGWRGTDELAWSNAVAEGAYRADELVYYIKVSDAQPRHASALSGVKWGAVVGFMDRIAVKLSHSYTVLLLVLL